jgi:nitroimidazol reductase NimA-like FMN-containing flavoprotein (pyridoxamine 5'-phosphate oxidase superfamily)
MSDYAPTARTTLRRRPQRGRYDRAGVHAILDAGLIGHVGFVEDGLPVVTPTIYWREGDRVYFHGSAASRTIRAAAAGTPICLTVSHLDGLVVARGAFYHSVNYRAVMAFGVAHLVEEPDQKMAAMRGLIERLYPGRWDEIRPPNEAELAAMDVVWLDLDEVSAKVRDDRPTDLPADLGRPAWAGVVPMAVTAGTPVASETLAPDVALPDYLWHWRWTPD